MKFSLYKIIYFSKHMYNSFEHEWADQTRIQLDLWIYHELIGRDNLDNMITRISVRRPTDKYEPLHLGNRKLLGLIPEVLPWYRTGEL